MGLFNSAVHVTSSCNRILTMGSDLFVANESSGLTTCVMLRNFKKLKSNTNPQLVILRDQNYEHGVHTFYENNKK